VSDVLPLARTHELSGYDAAYLEFSIRYGASLATLDVKVQRAAEAAGITLFVGKAPN
jgi:predicted nucleic acid-binding protein